jgi:FkbM family methyltransferase
MFAELKVILRNILPKKYQVPVKYSIDWVRKSFEVEMSVVKLLVSPGDHVIDVGGNRGLYAYHFWRLGAVVDVFEPNPICSEILNAWADDKSSVNIHSVGLSKLAGETMLNIPIDLLGIEHDASGSIENNDFSNSRCQKIPLATLDSFMFKNVSFIKIDVEGHESSVLEGAKLTILSSKPVLLVEIEQRHIHKPIADVFEEIGKLGYQGFFMKAKKLIPLDFFNLNAHQSIQYFGGAKVDYINNFLFLPKIKLAAGAYADLFD